MHIELFEQKEKTRGAKNQWYWRTVNKGVTTAVHGQWDDRAHAARQAKAHIVSCIKPYADDKMHLWPKPVFTKPVFNAEKNCWIIRWS
jgi:hypothetical protein